MGDKAAAKTICVLIDRVRRRQEEAGAIVEAAHLLAKRGKADRALTLLMDFEGPTRDALDLFTTALTIKRELFLSAE